MRHGPAGQGHQREIDRIIVITQVKHPREAGAGELGFVPGAVVPLRADQPADAADRGRMLLPGRRPAAPAPPRRFATRWAVPGRGGRDGRSCRAIRPSRRRPADGPTANWPPADHGRVVGRTPTSPGRRATARCRKCSSRPSGRTNCRRPAGWRGDRPPPDRPPDRPRRRPSLPKASSTRPVRSGVLGIDHRVVIGEGDVAEELAVVVAIEGPPAAVVVLHGQQPAQAAVDGRHRVAAVGDAMPSLRPSRSLAQTPQSRQTSLLRRQLPARLRSRRIASARPSAPSPCRRSRDRTRWHTRSTSRPARRRRSPPSRRAACLLAPAASRRRGGSAGCSAPTPLGRNARTAMAVSQTGDLHGCSRSVPAAAGRRSPGRRAAAWQYCIGALSSA